MIKWLTDQTEVGHLNDIFTYIYVKFHGEGAGVLRKDKQFPIY
jgi:hypothetical protein